MTEIGDLLLVLVITVTVFSIPYIVGRNILRNKKPGKTAGDMASAVILLVVYWSGISVVRFMESHHNHAQYKLVNEAFMFYAEKNFGIEKLYHQSQKSLRERQDKERRRTVEMPDSRFMFRAYPDDETVRFFFWNQRDAPRVPLSLEIKKDGGGGSDHPDEHAASRHGYASFWHENMRIDIEQHAWERYFNPTGPLREIMLFFLLWVCSTCWLFPLAATACTLRSKWAFHALWSAVLVFYAMEFRQCAGNLPAWQYFRCTPQKAVAELTKTENQEALRKLLQKPTSIVENASGETVIEAPLLCSGDFFKTKFLCWDLGKSNYLYYSQTDLRQTELVTANADISLPAKDFYLVRYPKLADACSRAWLRFAAIQAMAGLLWLGMFVAALKKRRKAGEISTPSELRNGEVRNDDH